MCEQCDDPDLTPDDWLERAREVIARERFAVQSVLGSPRVAEFSYTAGLTAYGLPELVITGVRPGDASTLLQVWGEYLLDQAVVLPGEVMGCGPWLLEAVRVSHPEAHLFLAADLFGDAVRALQLAWADPGGRWPWEPGHQARGAGQPLLGARAPRYCAEHAPDRLVVPPHLP